MNAQDLGRRTVLVTGATGLVGSAVAASLLRAGADVVALARAGEAAVRAAVQRAAFGLLGEGVPTRAPRLRVLSTDLERLREHGDTLAGIDVGFHAAAEMSFSADRLDASYQFNVAWTGRLHQLLAEHSSCGRLYYCSTVYTGGLGASAIREELHLTPRLITPYLVTKWAAELLLDRLASALPVTILRPSLIVGSAESGWYGGKSFGPYAFLDALRAARERGAQSVTLGVEPTIRHDYVPIDVLSHHVVSLLAADVEQRPLEIVHLLGDEVENRRALAIASRLVGIEVASGAPTTPTDLLAASIIGPALALNSAPNVVGRFPLSATVLRDLLQDRFRPVSLDDGRLERMFRWYLDEANAT